uniref:Uncharacterized protein n=1 Tax=Heterorhabditis bacteriophora TaxID=37862 RepID=A0A1I7WQF4_HETBA
MPQPSTPSKETERLNWTRKLSKTLNRRSGSFIASLVPFRKSSTVDEDLQTTSKSHRRTSAAAEVLLTTSVVVPAISSEHKERQRRRSADRIYALKAQQV